MSASSRSRALRWTAPLAVAAVIALIASVPRLTASATPRLAPLTAQQLVANVEQTNVDVLSGEVQLTANLGIPSLGSLSVGGGGEGGFNPTELLSGTHTAEVWYDGPLKARVALLRDMAESDVVLNGNDLWVWDSTGSRVTHTRVGGAASGGGNQSAADAAEQASPIKTPAQEAKDLLDNITPSTVVSVGPAGYVANRKAYQLLLQPRDAASTVGRVAVAVDAGTWLPLRVEVFARGATRPAVELRFAAIHYSRPAASNFVFTPPPGSTVNAKSTEAGRGILRRGRRPAFIGGTERQAAPAFADPIAGATASGSGSTTVGQNWSQVVVIDNGPWPRGSRELLQSARSVSGSWGSGRMVESALLNVLFLDDGRIAIGAVTPPVLEAAAASTR